MNDNIDIKTQLIRGKKGEKIAGYMCASFLPIFFIGFISQIISSLKSGIITYSYFQIFTYVIMFLVVFFGPWKLGRFILKNADKGIEEINNGEFSYFIITSIDEDAFDNTSSKMCWINLDNGVRVRAPFKSVQKHNLEVGDTVKIFHYSLQDRTYFFYAYD